MNSRFRPYRKFPHLSITNSVTRQGGSINIIQVTVYSFTVPALKLMKVKFCLFLATTAHCHDRAAIKIHITTFNRINLHVCCGNLHNFNCFWLSIITIYYFCCPIEGKSLWRIQFVDLSISMSSVSICLFMVIKKHSENSISSESLLRAHKRYWQ